MAVTIINSTNSLTTGVTDSDSGAYLFVAQDGYIATSAFGDFGFQSEGAAHVTVAGTITAAVGVGIYCLYDGQDPDQGGASVIHVTQSGFVSGLFGVGALGGANQITNDGSIEGFGILDGQSGATPSAILCAGDGNLVNNTGSIRGFYGVYNDGEVFRLVNTGVLIGSAYSIGTSGSATVANAGTIIGSMLIDGALDLTNTGLIDGTVSASLAVFDASTVFNYGTITGTLATSIGGDEITNDGKIGAVDLSAGADTFVNGVGATVYGEVNLGSGNDADIVTNDGRIGGGLIAGGGDDVIDSSNGAIGGLVNLGDGADTYTGGTAADRVIGGAGADTIELGDGRDVYRATDGDGNDDLDGGDGVDTYNASAVTTTITLNLGAATTGNAVGNDTIAGFENVIGGSAADNLSGDDGANRIDGQDGADVIFGDSGNDRLIGGLGTDTITGGAGRDILTGGDHGSLDSDKFVFAVGDSGATASTRDVITDFRDHRSNVPAMFLSNPDQINLSAIDANTGVAGDQAFSFNETGGAAFSGAAGSLIWRQFTGFALISGDTNGDGTADFVIQLNGTHGLFTSDFVL